jgi:molecular chaperone DnaK
VSRSQFEELTRDLVERTRFTINNLLRDAGQDWSNVTRVILVGGATRMPMIREMLERESGQRVDDSVSKDEAVAQGAALYAGLLLASHPMSTAGMKVNNVNSHSLGVLGIELATGRPRNKVLIPRNTRLPARSVHRFQSHRDNQRSVAVNVIEGGDASGNGATPIGKCVIRDLPPGLAKGTRVDVIFEYAANGRLSVKASIPQVQKTAQIDIERATGLSAETVDAWSQRLRYDERIAPGN